MKIAYFGTPAIADGCLKAVLDGGYDVCCVVTREDKPQGRGYKTDCPPVKKTALERGIPVYQPSGLRNTEAKEFLEALGADMFITCAYGRIFPPEILAIPPMGCINVHASLLPSLRGASPINRAIMNGDTLGGITIMRMDEGMDTGDIILTEETEISDDTDFGEYYERLTVLGGSALLKFLKLAESGDGYRTYKQDSAAATYAPKVEKTETAIDFSDTRESVYNKIRGLSPSPCAFAYLAGKRCKIYKAVRCELSGTPGSVISADKNGITVACGDKSVTLTELQPEGKGRMTAAAFIAGNKVI